MSGEAPWADADALGGHDPQWHPFSYGSHPPEPPYATGRQEWSDPTEPAWLDATTVADLLGLREATTATVPNPRVPLIEHLPPPAAPPAAPVHRSRRRPGRIRRPWLQVLGSLFGALTAVAFVTVCVTAWMLSYAPLRHLVDSRTPQDMAKAWPIVVHGPWLAGCLSVLRAALNGRRAAHSWAVVAVFSCLATGLCTAGAAHTAPAMVVAGLPPLAGAVCLHQFVRQLTATTRPAPRTHARRVRG
ncbi:DUF2637 domain-containing protein [Kitasatospora sp. NPDC088346]|uniref:DUF2637 domain-containing protein n=1 Tax=Kitasatospora sp. NPDC088346 TaxID=3364073 RepID=UPI003808EFE2